VLGVAFNFAIKTIIFDKVVNAFKQAKTIMKKLLVIFILTILFACASQQQSGNIVDNFIEY